MNGNHIQNQAQRGFTRADLCAVLMAITVLAIVALPALGKMKPHSDRASCINNLRQLGVGWISWAKENGDQLPWYVERANGGTKTLGTPYVHFAILSNYVASPAIMVCPSDTVKKPARDFTDDSNKGLLSTNFQNNAVGYFLSTEAVEDDPRTMLAGDRDINSTSPASGNCGNVNFNTYKIRRGGYWPTNSLHSGVGNLIYCDGSARATNAKDLYQTVQDNPIDANKSACMLIP